MISERNRNSLKAIMDRTIAAIFFLPIVIGDRQEFKKMGFVNAYLDDVDYTGKEEDMRVFVLFKPADLGRFKLFTEGEREKGRRLVDDYDYPGYTMLVYRLEEKLRKDYEVVLQGRYSEVSNEYRSRLPAPEKWILDTPEYEDLPEKDRFVETPLVWAIINKNECMRKDWEDIIGELPGNGLEYWSKVNSEREIFSFQEYKKRVNIK